MRVKCSLLFVCDLIGNVEGIIRLSAALYHLTYDMHIDLEMHSSRYIVHTYAFAVAYISMSFRYHRAGDARAYTYASTRMYGVSLASLTTVHSMGKYWLHIMHSNTRIYVYV